MLLKGLDNWLTRPYDGTDEDGEACSYCHERCYDYAESYSCITCRDNGPAGEVCKNAEQIYTMILL